MDISQLKIRYTKLRGWIIVITFLYEKTLKTSLVVEKIVGMEAEDLKKIENHYFDKRKGIMENTEFKVEDFFSDITSNGSISTEQITKPSKFSAKMM